MEDASIQSVTSCGCTSIDRRSASDGMSPGVETPLRTGIWREDAWASASSTSLLRR